MNLRHFRLTGVISILVSSAAAQTFFAPGGTVGTSTTGGVGIGTSTPGSSSMLDVYQAASRTNAVIFEVNNADSLIGYSYGIWLKNRNATNGNYTSLLNWDANQNGNAWIDFINVDHTTPKGQLAFSTRNGGNYSRRMVIDENGNVGIGTATPVNKFEIASGVSGNFNGLHIYNNDGSSAAAAYSASLSLGRSASHTEARLTASNETDGTFANGYLAFSTRFNEAVVERLRIASTGNVGIGTTGPGSLLHLRGAAGTGAPVIGGGALYLQDSGGAGNNGGAVLFGASQGYFAGIKGLIGDGTQNTTGDLAIFTRNLYSDANLTERVRIASNGNVGIGTPTPAQKLSVNGAIRAKEVIVDTGWSDYVFDESYELKALSETEAFIKSEKHLPGIPSASEVAEHGISVGEMQAKLLAKIEELTLHVIAQGKDLTELKSENHNLRNRVVELETHTAP